MPVDQVHHTRVRIQTEESQGPRGVVRTSTQPGQTVRHERPVSLSTQVDGDVSATSGDLPPPMSAGGDGRARRTALRRQIDVLTSIVSRKAELEALAQSGNAQARQLLPQVNQAQTLLDNLQTEMEFLEDDIDGDGIENYRDPDMDGDQLTNEAEAELGTDPTARDSDGDGLSDGVEIEIRDTIEGFEWMDPLAADANGDGRTDNLNLPETLRRRFASSQTGQPVNTTTTPNTPSPEVTSESVSWPRRNTTTDAVITLSGDLTITRDGRNLIVTNAAGGRQTVENYYNAEGRVSRIAHFDGTVGSLNVVGIPRTDLNPITRDGVATAGIHFRTATPTITNTVNPFAADSASTLDRTASTPLERVYNAAPSTFTVPTEYNGKVIKHVEVVGEGADALVRLRERPNGDVVVTFRLRGGKALVEGEQLKFQLSETRTTGGIRTGQIFDGSAMERVYVTGSRGDDKITGSGHLFGGDGDDMLYAGQNGATLDGGNGNDWLIGDTGVDNLIGGSGNDFLISGAGTLAQDILEGGTGNDVLITNYTDASARGLTGGIQYRVSGGGNTDMSNYTASPTPDVEVNQRESVDRMIRQLQASLTTTPPPSTAQAEIIRRNIETLRMLQAVGGSSVTDAALTLVRNTETEFENQILNGGQAHFTMNFDAGITAPGAPRPRGTEDPPES